MSEPGREIGLDDRAREVLREIVRLHAETGRPVSSRSLSKQKKFHASSATLRNLMADLTDAGYLSQPHTSAGRVPTEKGYRYYIRSLMKPREVTPNQRERVSTDLLGAGHEAKLLFPAVSRLLSRLTGEVGVVVAPDARQSIVREIRFVPIGRDKVLAVQVGEADLVFTRVIETEAPWESGDLEWAGNYLTAEFAGSSLSAMRSRINRSLREERLRLDRLRVESLSLGRKALPAETGIDVYTEGARHLLDHSEIAEPATLKRIYRALEEKTHLLELLDRCLEGEGPRIVIGEESHLTSENPVSAVLTRYGGEGYPPGILGIVGPLRMPYPRVVPLVEFLGKTLSEKLKESGEQRENDGPEES